MISDFIFQAAMSSSLYLSSLRVPVVVLSNYTTSASERKNFWQTFCQQNLGFEFGSAGVHQSELDLVESGLNV